MNKLSFEYENQLTRQLTESVRTSLIAAARAFGSFPVRRVVVAVSGGQDSVVLLHVLATLARTVGIELSVCHVNHRLRPESNTDASFVEKMCSELKIPCAVYQAPSRPKNENLEAWAREIRYQFLEQHRNEVAAEMVLTAHHQRDLAETFFFKLLSRRFLTSGVGLAHIDQDRKVVRPMLRISKAQIEQYSKIHSLSFVEDQSNFDLARTRNNIRHKILPLLTANFNADAEQSLANAAQRLANDEDYLDSQARKARTLLVGPEGIKELLGLAPAIQWRAVRELARGTFGDDADKISYHHLCAIVERVASGHYDFKCIELGHGLLCYVRNREGIIFERGSSIAERTNKNEQAISLLLPGQVTINFCGQLWSITASLQDVTAQGTIEAILRAAKEKGNATPLSVAEAYLDYGELAGVVPFVRTRTAGELVDVAFVGQRKLKKAMQDKNVPVFLRDAYPVIALADQILWVPGVCRSTKALLKPSTVRILKLEFTPCR